MGDECRPVEIDGEIIRVHGGAPMTDEDRGFMAEIVRAAKEKFAADRAARDEASSAAYPSVGEPDHAHGNTGEWAGGRTPDETEATETDNEKGGSHE